MSHSLRSFTGLFPFALLILGCSDSSDGNGSPPTNGLDAGTSADADDGSTEAAAPLYEEPPTPGELLSPSSYDCSSTTPPTPPERPHDSDCFRAATCTSPLIAGHRMATAFAPENSLSALRAAILLGIDMVETDVRLTADGEVVLIHDGEVDRTLEGEGAVNEMTLAQIQALPMRVVASKHPGDFSCDRAPELGEALALARGRIVVELEVKDSEAGVISARYLRDQQLYDTAFLLCDAAECAALRAAVPDAPIMYRARSAAEVVEALALDPPPILVHGDPTPEFLDKALLEQLHQNGAKLYGNAFTQADILAFGGDLGGYPQMFEDGLDVVQSEYGHWALAGLGRLKP